MAVAVVDVAVDVAADVCAGGRGGRVVLFCDEGPEVIPAPTEYEEDGNCAEPEPLFDAWNGKLSPILLLGLLKLRVPSL